MFAGTILEAVLNAPGSWHDSRIARPVYGQLIHNTLDGYFLVADTAFPRGSTQVGHKIKAPLKSGDKLPRGLLARTERLALDRQLLSYRQTAEWGMRVLQGGFGRLHVPLHVDPAQHMKLLRVITRAFNLRARRVGINQIRAVYCDIWRQAEGDEIWSNFASMVLGDLRNNDRVARFHTMAVEKDS
jgi:DDE superfamily endonuclease